MAGVGSAVRTGQSPPVSYWPGGRRRSAPGRPRPVNPRVTFAMALVVHDFAGWRRCGARRQSPLTGFLPRCSFCGKFQDQVKKIIAGPGVFICDECVLLCLDIIGPPTEEQAELVAGA